MPPAESQRALPLPDKPSIAGLAFQNMSGDPEQEYFSDGITEDIITNLSKYRGFFVIARNSSFTYKGRAYDVYQVPLPSGSTKNLALVKKGAEGVLVNITGGRDLTLGHETAGKVWVVPAKG